MQGELHGPKAKHLLPAPGKLWLFVAAHALVTAGVAAPIHFQEHLIEKSIPGGYRVVVTDMNRDGRPDVIGLSGRGAELYWYENPTWERHVIAGGMTRMISVAAADIDGDGIPELALATHFGQTDETSEGRVFHLHHQGDPRQPWKITEFDRLPTSHRLLFADLDGDGKKELVNAALTGPGARQPLFECRTRRSFSIARASGNGELIYDQARRNRPRPRRGGLGRLTAAPRSSPPVSAASICTARPAAPRPAATSSGRTTA